MKKQLMIFMVLISTVLFATACSNGAYQDAVDKGIQSLGEKDYRQAALHFEVALKEEKDDSEAERYFEQANLLSDAESAYDEQRYDEALSYITKVLDSENSLQVVQKDAEDLKNRILEEQEKSAAYSVEINNIQTLIDNGEYKTAQTQLQKMTQEIKDNEKLSSFLEKCEELSQQAADGIAAVEKEQAVKEREEEEKQSASSNVSYNTYQNGRFGFSIAYPATFTKGPEPTNGDGREFYDQYSTLLAYGGFTNIIRENETIEMYYDDALSEAPGEVSYKKLASDWFVVSYQDGNNIVYTKFLFRDSFYNQFTFTYPASMQNVYGEMVAPIAESFHAIASLE